MKPPEKPLPTPPDLQLITDVEETSVRQPTSLSPALPTIKESSESTISSSSNPPPLMEKNGPILRKHPDADRVLLGEGSDITEDGGSETDDYGMEKTIKRRTSIPSNIMRHSAALGETLRGIPRSLSGLTLAKLSSPQGEGTLPNEDENDESWIPPLSANPQTVKRSTQNISPSPFPVPNNTPATPFQGNDSSPLRVPDYSNTHPDSDIVRNLESQFIAAKTSKTPKSRAKAVLSKILNKMPFVNSPAKATDGVLPTTPTLNPLAETKGFRDPTTVADELVDEARNERNRERQARLFKMAEALITAIEEAKNAEKAAEKAATAVQEIAALVEVVLGS